MRKIVAVTITAAAILATGAAQGEHAGCVATTAEPTCTYTAIGAHQALGFSQGGWEASVTRTVNGTPTKVVVGTSAGGSSALGDVTAAAGELVTFSLKPGAQGVIGAVSSGNTSGHT